MLDGGADIRADAKDLMQYALMGTSYARNGFGLKRPRVGLLNVGTEEHKGRAELKEAHDLIKANARRADFEFVGFVEGRDLPGDDLRCDRHRRVHRQRGAENRRRHRQPDLDLLRQAFKYSHLSRMASVLAFTSMRRLKERIDPRRAMAACSWGLTARW